MSEAIIQEAAKLVEDLYKYRDNYFVDNPVDDVSSNRDQDVASRLQKTLEEIDDLTGKLDGRDRAATQCLLKGKALNVLPQFSKECFDLLSKAVKLNPQETEAWNQLGECFWKKDDLNAALNCFEGAYKHDKQNAQTLRNLSMALRQVAGTPEERTKNLIRSLELANAAVKADVMDGASWSVLGNAYMIMFCKSPNLDLNFLKSCDKAYRRVKLDEVASNQPDFLFNYANLLLYKEEYQEVLNCLRKASLMDPGWGEPLEWRNAILKYFRDVCDMIVKRGSLKPKRIQSFAEALRAPDLKKFGPYKVGTDYTHSRILQLKEGLNPKTVVALKVIGCVMYMKAVCMTVCAMDEECNCVAVTIYNVGKEPKIGDTVVIAEPFFKKIEVDIDISKANFSNIRVDNPIVLVVNGKPFPKEYLARPKVDNVYRPN